MGNLRGKCIGRMAQSSNRTWVQILRCSERANQNKTSIPASGKSTRSQSGSGADVSSVNQATGSKNSQISAFTMLATKFSEQAEGWTTQPPKDHIQHSLSHRTQCWSKSAGGLGQIKQQVETSREGILKVTVNHCKFLSYIAVWNFSESNVQRNDYHNFSVLQLIFFNILPTN